MIPATVAPAHSISQLDRIAFCKSVREKRKQLQLNLHSTGKDNNNINSSTENAFLTQMLQTSSTSASTSATSTVNSSLDISSLLKKNSSSSSFPTATTTIPSHRTVTGTLTNILPALLNGTVNAHSPRSTSPNASFINNSLSIVSPTSTDTLVDAKCSTSLPVSPAIQTSEGNIRSNIEPILATTTNSPPRCHSYPMSALTKRSSPPTVTSTVSPTDIEEDSPISYLLATASSCPSLVIGHSQTIFPSNSPSPDDNVPKIVRSASVKSCASDSGVSSSSPLSDNNIVHVFRTNQIDTNHLTSTSSGSRKRKSLAHVSEELNRDKKFSSEATISSAFPLAGASSASSNIPYSQQEALAIGYAQYALMHTLTQQFRANYPAALLHAAAASAYLPLSAPMMAAAAAVAAAQNASKPPTMDKSRERRKGSTLFESDSNNNHLPSNSSIHDQPYRRETFQTLLESSRLAGQQNKLLKPVPIDLRKHNGTSRMTDHSPIPTHFNYPSSSSSSMTSPPSSPPCMTPPKSTPPEPVNDFVCIPKKLMPVVTARINDWLERNVNFVLSLSVVQDTLDNEKDKYLLLSRIWHRLLLTSMIENTFEIYVTKDLQISHDLSSSSSSSSTSSSSSLPSSPSNMYPTENDVKQIESLINRGKTLEIDEFGFNLIREVIIYKEGKTLFDQPMGHLFEKAECQAQARLTSWCSTRVKYSKIVFFLCNIYQVKEDIFERLFCGGSMHQSTPIRTHLQRFLASSNPTDA